MRMDMMQFISLDMPIVLAHLNATLHAVWNAIKMGIDILTIGNQQSTRISNPAKRNQNSLVLNTSWLIKFMQPGPNMLNIVVITTIKVINLTIHIIVITHIKFIMTIMTIMSTKHLRKKWVLKNIKNILNMLDIAINLRMKLKNYKIIVSICLFKIHSMDTGIKYDRH